MNCSPFCGVLEEVHTVMLCFRGKVWVDKIHTENLSVCPQSCLRLISPHLESFTDVFTPGRI